MPEIASVALLTQLGIESTEGVAVAASKRLQSLSLDLDPEGEFQIFTPSGQLFPTISAPMSEQVGGDVEGEATYTELIYPMSSALKTAAITTPAGGTASRDWTFSLAPGGGEAYKSFTVERGSSVRGWRAAGVVFSSFGLDFGRDEIAVSGSVVGKAIETGFTMTTGGGVTAVALIPILGTQVSVYADDTWAGLGTTKLLRVAGASFSLGDRRNPVWVLDAAQSSYVATVETMPTTEVTLRMAADSVGEGLYTSMRAGSTKFLRVEAVGPIIEGAIPYKARFDMAMKVTDAPSYDDEEGLRVIEWSGQLFTDPTSSKAFEAVITNNLTAL